MTDEICMTDENVVFQQINDQVEKISADIMMPALNDVKSISIDTGSLGDFVKENEQLLTEGNVEKYKKNRTSLNKLIAKVKEFEKKLKTAMESGDIKMKYEAVKAVRKELEGVSEAMGQQLDVFTEKEKADKKEQIKKYFDDKNNYKDYFTFDMIFKNEWCNKTTSMTVIQQEIDTKLAIVDRGMEELNKPAYDNENKSRTIAKFFEKLDILDAINENNDFLTRKQEFEKRKQQEAEAKARADQETAAAQRQPSTTETAPAGAAHPAAATVNTNDTPAVDTASSQCNKKTICLIMEMDTPQLQKIIVFCKENNIDLKRFAEVNNLDSFIDLLMKNGVDVR